MSVFKCLFCIDFAVCEMESTQLTAFHKVAFCPLLSSVFADLKGLFNDNRRKESTIYLIKSLHIIVNSLLDKSQAEFWITLDQLHFLKQATSIRPLLSVICLFNTVFGKLWTILECPDNIWSRISLLTKWSVLLEQKQLKSWTFLQDQWILFWITKQQYVGKVKKYKICNHPRLQFRIPT